MKASSSFAIRTAAATVLSAAMLLTGCVDAMPALTAEQSELIAEYAAGLILKYSPRYNYKIAGGDQVVAAREELAQETGISEEEIGDVYRLSGYRIEDLE